MNKISITISIIFFLLLGFFVISSFDTSRDVKLAKTYIKEYRFAKALSLLNDSNRKPSLELKQLLFYAAIKAKNFKTAEVIVDDIEKFDANFKTDFYELINLLYKKDQDLLIAKVLSKSGNIKLEQDYLISLAKKQKNIDREMQVLLMGRKLFLDIREDLLSKKKINEAQEIEIDKLEKYILERYMNQANLFIAHQDYASALEQMKSAELLLILAEPDKSLGEEKAKLDKLSFKEEKALYKFLLGSIYKFMGEKDKAMALINESAELGNIQASESLEQAKRVYRKN